MLLSLLYLVNKLNRGLQVMHVLLHLAFPTVEATLDKQIKFYNIKVIFSNTIVVNDINVQSRVMPFLSTLS